MQMSFRSLLLAGAVATLCALTVTLAAGANSRPQILIASPAAGSATTSTFNPGVITNGDAIVSKTPDIAFLSVGVDSLQPTATEAQRDLADKAGKLIARAKALGIADKDTGTSGYSVGPNYTPGGVINGYRASEQLQLKWHDVSTVGKALDALVQEGGATTVGVGFGLADPKVAQAEARSLAIADARSRARAMATAAGVKLGPVLRVSDLSTSGGVPVSRDFAPAAGSNATQVPVGQLDVQVTVEVDFAID
jgi:uncharacterized protein